MHLFTQALIKCVVFLLLMCLTNASLLASKLSHRQPVFNTKPGVTARLSLPQQFSFEKASLEASSKSARAAERSAIANEQSAKDGSRLVDLTRKQTWIQICAAIAAAIFPPLALWFGYTQWSKDQKQGRQQQAELSNQHERNLRPLIKVEPKTTFKHQNEFEVRTEIIISNIGVGPATNVKAKLRWYGFALEAQYFGACGIKETISLTSNRTIYTEDSPRNVGGKTYDRAAIENLVSALGTPLTDRPDDVKGGENEPFVINQDNHLTRSFGNHKFDVIISYDDLFKKTWTACYIMRHDTDVWLEENTDLK